MCHDILHGSDESSAARIRRHPLPTRAGAAAAERLLEWLGDGAWRDTWTPEPSVHPSAGTHGGNVRVWYSPTLVEDLAANRRRFRKGAAMVTELYFDGVDTIEGWSAMVKVRSSRGNPRRAWWYHETFDLRPGNDFVGRGLPLCVGCHAEGTDHLRSSFRP